MPAEPTDRNGDCNDGCGLSTIGEAGDAPVEAATSVGVGGAPTEGEEGATVATGATTRAFEECFESDKDAEVAAGTG